MKRFILIVALTASLSASAGAYTVFVRLPSGTIETFESMDIPTPDEHGRYRFRIKKTVVVVHVSHVWVMKK